MLNTTRKDMDSSFSFRIKLKSGLFGALKTGQENAKRCLSNRKIHWHGPGEVRKRVIAFNYRKRPCTSRTFFHKIEAKNQGVAYPWIHLCLEFSKT